MQCDVCGQKEQQYTAIIEGSTLSVCQYCAKFGKVIRKIETEKEKSLKKSESAQNKVEIIESIVPDFSSIIRKKRESMGLNQEDFAKKLRVKTSILHKIETGHYTPDLDTAKRIEKLLGIKLVEKDSIKNSNNIKSDKEIKGMTIGDFIKINKK